MADDMVITFITEDYAASKGGAGNSTLPLAEHAGETLGFVLDEYMPGKDGRNAGVKGTLFNERGPVGSGQYKSLRLAEWVEARGGNVIGLVKTYGKGYTFGAGGNEAARPKIEAAMRAHRTARATA